MFTTRTVVLNLYLNVHHTHLEPEVVLNVYCDGRPHPVHLAADGLHVAEQQRKLPLGVCAARAQSPLSHLKHNLSCSKKGQGIYHHGPPLHPESTSIPITCKHTMQRQQKRPACAAPTHGHQAESAAAEVPAQPPQAAVVLQASAQMHMHDVVFHVIFGADARSIWDFVQASAVRLHSITQCPFLASMIRGMAAQQHALDAIKALFFLLLNVDMVLKEYVCSPGCVKAFAAAMNVRRPAAAERGKRKAADDDEPLARMHAWSMIGTRAMDPAKARRFFTVLHDSIVKMWLQDERLHASDLVQMVKEEYLVC